MRTWIQALPAVCLLTLSQGQVLEETFDGPNVDDWGIDFLPGGQVMTTGGNPGGRLEVTMSNTTASLPAPTLFPRAAGNPWGGNWRVQGVQSFSYDRQVEAGMSNFGTFPSVLVGNNNGTPNDFIDDTWVWVITGDNLMWNFDPWKTVSVDIDSGSAFLPGDWFAQALPGSPNVGLSDDDLWNLVMEDVTYVGVTAGFPWNGGTWFGSHVISYDNMRLTYSSISGNYCTPAVPNTTGFPGSITAVGSQVAAMNDLTLRGSNLPEGEFAYFLGSRTQGFIANPNNSQGNLCVAGSIARFNTQVGQVTSGQFSIQVDLTNVPEPPFFGVSVLAGETWNFQCWHRDFLAGSGPTSNFTDAIEITFQ